MRPATVRPVITALAGGVGAARLLRGMVEVVPPGDITAVVNVGDDTDLHGLHISPDLDTVMYTLADAINPETGWGLAGETWRVMESLGRLGGVTWFNLGDQDLATHCYRTQRLAEGASLGTVTAELASGLRRRRPPPSGHRRPAAYPAPARGTGTRSASRSTSSNSTTTWPCARSGSPVRPAARPAPGVLEAIDGADMVVVCPSNPVVSIDPVLAVPGIHEALAARRDSIVAVSPIVAGAALKGPADRLLVEMGFESSVVGVARWYAPWVGTLVVDEADAALAPAVEAEGVRCIVAPTIMSDVARSAALARVVLDAGA